MTSFAFQSQWIIELIQCNGLVGPTGMSGRMYCCVYFASWVQTPPWLTWGWQTTLCLFINLTWVSLEESTLLQTPLLGLWVHLVESILLQANATTWSVVTSNRIHSVASSHHYHHHLVCGCPSTESVLLQVLRLGFLLEDTFLLLSWLRSFKKRNVSSLKETHSSLWFEEYIKCLYFIHWKEFGPFWKSCIQIYSG